MKIAGIIILALLLMIGLSFAMGWTDVLYTKTVGKAQENARREVFEQTQSYVEGKRQELTKYRLEYMEAKDEQEKHALKVTILQSFANFDVTKLPPDLQTFLESLKY